MFDSTNQAIYEPDYISLLLLLLGIVYVIYFGITIVKIKLDTLAISTLAISLLTYLLVGFYMAGFGFYIDEETPNNLVFEKYGFPDLILLAFPYIFLSLAASLGEKKRNK